MWNNEKEAQFRAELLRELRRIAEALEDIAENTNPAPVAAKLVFELGQPTIQKEN